MSDGFIGARLLGISRICGRVLVMAYGVGVVLALFPIQISSPDWGLRFSGVVVESASLVLVGVAMLSAAAFLQPIPVDPEIFPHVIPQRIFVLRLCRWGVIALVLLALWQPVLLAQRAGEIIRGSLGQSGSLQLALQTAEQSIARAPAAELDRLWQVFIDRQQGAPSALSPAGTEDRRQALLAAIRLEQEQNRQALDARRRQAVFTAVLNMLRRVSLCVVYAAGFYALRRFLLLA